MGKWTEEEIKAVYDHFFGDMKFMSLEFVSEKGKKQMMNTLPAFSIVLRMRITSAIVSAVDTLKRLLGRA